MHMCARGCVLCHVVGWCLRGQLMWSADQSSVLIVCVPQEGPFWPMTLKPTQHHSGLWATSPNELHGSPAVALAALRSHNVCL